MRKYIILFLLCLLPILTLADDWPLWRGPHSDGISREIEVMTSWSQKGLKVLWRKPLGVGYSGISVVKGTAYTAYGDSDYEYVVAVNANSGKQVWKKRIGYLYKSNIGSGPRATPTIENGRLYIVSAHGDFWCLKTKTGKTIWNFNILRKFNVDNLKWGMCGSAVIYKNLLLYNVGGQDGKSLMAFNKNTGEKVWATGSDSAAYSTPLLANIHGEMQAIFFVSTGLVSVEPASGKTLWRYQWPVQKNAVTPIYHNGYIYFSSSYSEGGGALLKITNNEGSYKVEKVWFNRRLKNHYATSILWKGHLYGFHGKRFTCVNFNSGKQMWTQRGFDKGLIVGINNGTAIVLGQRGNLGLVKLDPEGYIEKGRYNLFARSNCLVVPTISNGRLFVRNNKEFVCLNILNQ